ncbi:MAG: methyltransferase domain-containing protein [Cytophagales bacterium]|nr:MAG: methyltransferase domain-containing protein [Cytophagales bacterium]
MTSLSQTYFDDIYRANEDPWNFITSDYERGKYEDTLNSLGRERYANAFEIGTSIGVLTAQLARRCDHLITVDASELPLKQARERLKDAPNVTIRQMAVPDEFPDELFDLILVSEVAYYWSMDDLHKAQQLMLDHLQPGGHLLLVHWTPEVHDYPLTGDAVHDEFLALTGDGQLLRHVHGHRKETYRVDLFEKM